MRHRSLGYFLLRLTLGMIFLVFGVQKLSMGPSAFAAMVVGQFAKTAFPLGLARAFGLVLPFLETGLGALIVLGLFTVPALAVTAVLLLVLTFGVALSEPQMIPYNLIYALICFVLLFTAEHNRWAVDDLRRARPPAGPAVREQL